MIIHGPPLFNRTTSPVWNCSMSRTPVGERLSPAYRRPRLPTRRTRVLLALLRRAWHPMPVFRLCSWGRRGKGVIVPSVCACVHTPPQQRLPRVWYAPSTLSPALRAASASSPMPQLLPCSLCKRYATPRSRLHTEARTAEG